MIQVDDIQREAIQRLHEIEKDFDHYVTKHYNERIYQIELERNQLDNGTHEQILEFERGLEQRMQARQNQIHVMHELQVNSIENNFDSERFKYEKYHAECKRNLYTDLVQFKYNEKWSIYADRIGPYEAIDVQLDRNTLIKQRKRKRQEVKLLGLLMDADYFPAGELEGLSRYEITQDLEEIRSTI